jgi:DNA-binding LacI/PurR family transcriptional regulator
MLGSNIAGRLAGYTRALQEHGCYDPDLMREADFVGQAAFDLALDLLATTDVDAIFTTSQSTALGVVRAAQHLKRRIPEDLALFGYDDVPWMEVVCSPVSTIRQPAEGIAGEAMGQLLECLNGKAPCDTVHVLESSLILRHSCGC